ncbi:MAG: 4'-phosphopantetheinyl transferase family protein [Bacteroidota bacterium]
MGLIYKEVVEGDCLMGIWDITESYDDLRAVLELGKEEEEKLNSFRCHARKIEWLSVRVLLKTLLGRQSKIVYNKQRKPFLAEKTHQISISHSRNYTSILLSKENKVGVDLEYMSHRISSIAHKFINDDEIITTNQEKKRYHLYIHWCAKEALYKIYDKQDINFKQNITILPFEPENNGTIKGIVSNRYGTESFDIHYFREDEYIVAWSAKDKMAIEKIFTFASNDFHI